MTPEDMVGIETMVSHVETLLNSFADSTTRIKQRMVSDGWSQESAEAFSVTTVGSLTAGLMTSLAAPEAQVLETKSMLLPLVTAYLAGILVTVLAAVLIGWLF